MRFSSPSATPEGFAIQCAYCGGPIALADLVESILCEHCGASSRIRLSATDRMRAHGYSEEQASTQNALENAAAKQDIDCALESTRAMTESMAPAGTPRSRELLFYYGCAMFPWMADRCDELVMRLSLSAPKRCRTCEERVALAPDGEGVCPLCQQKP
jgi:hypothetical protein